MAVLGRLLVSSAERLDLPDLLSIDSYAAGDWKYFLKGIVGDSRPYILKGFDVIDPQNAIGTQNCSIRVADSMVFYPGSAAGSFFHGLQEGHEQAAPLIPELRKNAVNYVYLTLSTLNTSADTRAFWDPDKDGGAGGEFTQDINTESVLKVDINVSVGSFPQNTIPIAKITVGPVVITSIEDARDMMFRLGSGGINPNPFNEYSWRSLPSAGYERTEPPTTMTIGGVNPFQGADKNIYSLKEWMDIVMSKLKELGGTSYWYEDAATYSLMSMFTDSCASAFKSKGQWTHSSLTPGLLTWSDDIHVKVTSDLRTYIVRSGNKTLNDEQVMYIPMVRQQAINATDELVAWVNGANYVNTIGGAIGLFVNLSKGDYVKKINDSNDKYLRVEEFYDATNLSGSTTSAANAKSIRLSASYQGTTSNERGRYDKGVYLASDVVVSDRDQAVISNIGGNFHWLAIRSDTIQNIASASVTSLTIDISEHDGSTAKVVSSLPHGLVDNDRVTISGSANFNGTYIVEVESSTIFYIAAVGGPFADELAVSAEYATIVTTTRSTAYGLQLESANHGFKSNDKIAISGTTNYNGSFLINVRDSITFTIPISGSPGAESAGNATLPRTVVRTEGGVVQVIQGQSANIGGTPAENIRQFVGMESLSETAPSYAVAPSYNTLDGMVNYNSLIGENLTARVSKLTAMMADKAQDKTIKILPSGYKSVTNTINGAAQDIIFDAYPLETPKVDIALSGSENNGVVTLTGTLSLLANQVAYISIDRNNAFSIASLAGVTVANITDVNIDENIYVLAIRLGTTDIWLWDGFYVPAGSPVPVPGYLDRIVKQNNQAKLVRGGTWSWDLGLTTVTWSLDAYIQVPNLTEARNTIVAASAVLPNDGDVAYVDINRFSGAVTNLTVNVSAINALALNADRFIIARRTGNNVILGNHSMLLIDGESKLLYAGSSDQTLAYTGQPDAADDTPTYTNVTNGLAAYPVVQGDDLTLAIGQTMGNVNEILDTLDQPSYDEFREIVLAAPTGNQLLGPVTNGTNINLPVNSRLIGSPQQYYVVGKGTLEIFLNGQMLQLGEAGGWSEVGTIGTPSMIIQINQQLEVGDFLTFRLDATGGPGSGGSSAPDDDFYTLPTSFTPDNADYVLTYDISANTYRKQTRSTFLSGVGGYLNVNNYNANISADVNNDDVILMDASGGNKIITLPSAATADGKIFYIKKTDSSSNTVMINGSGANIDGVASILITVQYEAYTITCDGTNWWIL